MRVSAATGRLLRVAVGITLAFIYIPLIVIAIYAFNKGITLKWPPESLSTKWFGEAIDNQDVKDAFVNSLKVGAIATLIALMLGTLASLGVGRHRFFGRETVSFLVVIPIAVSAAAESNVSERPLLMGVCAAASAAFLTPVATPVNLMVMGPGGYRFGDYWKLGGLLLAWFFVVVMVVVPLVWQF